MRHHIDARVGVALCAQLIIFAAATSAVHAATFFDDAFLNGIPLVNDGVGGNWTDVSQGGGPHLPHSEADGILTVQDGTGSFQIGMIRTTDGFSWGNTVRLELSDVEITDAVQNIDRGAGQLWYGYAVLSVIDSQNTEAGANSPNNDSLAAMDIEIGSDGSDWGFVAKVAGSRADEALFLASGAFDEPVDGGAPLVATIRTDDAANFWISFNKSYDGGKTDAIPGNAVVNTEATLGPTFDIGVGAQGVHNSDAIALYDRASVLSPAPIVLGDMDIDGDVDFDDVDDFVLGLNNASDYFDAYGVSPELHGDVNGDSFFDFDDISGFVGILRNAELHKVAEPSVHTLVIVCVLSVVTCVRHRDSRLMSGTLCS